MASQVTKYQCPACTAPLEFDPKTGRLSCEFCGSSFTVEEVEAMFKAKNEAAVSEAEMAAEKQKAEDPWDTSYTQWGPEAEGMRAYGCTSCGAELICDSTTAATVCPYCGNPTVMPAQFSSELKPDFVLPFKITRQQAMEALQKHYGGKKLLPKVFAQQNNVEKVQGIYVPFWLYDGEVAVEADYSAERVRTHTEGSYRVTTTSEFALHRAGRVPFEKIPVDASKRMDDALMDSIEPYDYRDLKPFSMAYLPGYLADKYDVSTEECAKRADTRAVNTAEAFLRSTTAGFSNVRERGKWVGLRRGKVHYALMPVWLLNTAWNGKSYTFAMNGQTGRFVGDLPMDKALYKQERLKWWAILSAAVFALEYFARVFL